MARGITKESELPPYAQAYVSRIRAFGFNWTFFEEYRLVDTRNRVQVRDIAALAPPREVAKYAADLRKGDQMPPVIVTADKVLVDGATRTEAARKVGWHTFPTFVLDVNAERAPDSVIRQLIYLGSAFNLTHGRGMNNANISKIVDFLAEDDDSPMEVARKLHIPVTQAGTLLNAAKAKKRAGQLGLTLDGSLTNSHLKVLGNKMKYFSTDVWGALLQLTQDAHLTIATTTALAKHLEELGTENEKMALLETERVGYRDVIEGGAANPSKAAKLRQSLGFLNGQDDPEVLAELEPRAARHHIQTLQDAALRLQLVIEEQERIERARLAKMGE